MTLTATTAATNARQPRALRPGKIVLKLARLDRGKAEIIHPFPNAAFYQLNATRTTRSFAVL
jgi:hypothetical protein